MFKERYRVRQLEYCNKQMFGNLVVTCNTYSTHMPEKLIQPVPITVKPVITPEEVIKMHLMEAEKRRASLLVDQLLLDIHNSFQHSTDYNSTTSGRSSQKYSSVQSHDLYKRDVQDLSSLTVLLGGQIERVGIKLVRRLKRREALRRQQEAQCDVITGQLKKLLPNATEDMCFTVNPQPRESGFSQWVAAMKMVAQLPGGIPPEFRRRLWLTMAEKHLTSKGVDWTKVERTCFSEWSHPDDGELGVQIVKDLHRTGCSLFCGEGGQENQALLKKVLLAYARWNKAVGYCQGFNMLAALILQVTEKSETDALKLMIYLIEGVLPDSYFADSLRGLSVDMAVFRELLRTRLPRLSKHLDLLQNMAKEGTTSYEPPLTNVFTMQWFLTLFCNCLPQPSVLRVWDLILLEGNEILLRTALAIWQALADRIVRVKTADEFYCIMGVLTNELLENNLMDANLLIKSVVSIGPLTELKSLREHYLYNINPWGAMQSPLEFSEKQLKLYPKERMALDISALKKQYMKLKQRQRQAHIIFTAAISRHPPPRTPVAMNHLLIGKSALVPAKRLGPPKGSIPPIRIPAPSTLLWKDTSKHSPSSSSSDTELCDENDPPSDPSDHSNQVSPIHELPQDNPQELDASIDNNAIAADVISKTLTPNTEECGVSVVFDTLVPSRSQDDVEQTVDLDSEDDSVDFELFLEDRVKCFKQEDSPSSEDSRVSLSRRNSERALQIIQENSLILHRILQCQSRLSLSPPVTETDADLDDDTLSKKSLDSCRLAGDGRFSSSCSSSETTTGRVYMDTEVASSSYQCETEGNFPDFPLPEIPVESTQGDGSYRSKYDEILERSRDLNAKYYSQILNLNDGSGGTCVVPESKTFTNQDELIDFSSDITTSVEEDAQNCGRMKRNPPDSPGFSSQSPSSSIVSISVPTFSKENDEKEKDQYAESTDEFHPSSIDFFRNFVTCDDFSGVSSSGLCKSHALSFAGEEFEPRQSDSSEHFDMERSQNRTKSDGIYQEKNFSLIDFSTDPRFGDTSGYHSKDSGTDSTSISDKDSSSIAMSGFESKSVSPGNIFSFDNLPLVTLEKKSLSATNSIERNDYSTTSRRSLSASNSIERATSSSKQMVVEELFGSSKDSFIRLKETIKSPELPFESSFRSLSENNSSTDLIVRESSIKYPNVEGKPDTTFKVAPQIIESERKTMEGLLPSSCSKNEEKFDCNFDSLDNILDSTRGELGFSKEGKTRSSNLRNLEDFDRTKSPVLDSDAFGTFSPTKGTKVVPILELEQETVEEFLPRSYIKNEENLECNFETLENISDSTGEEFGYSREGKTKSSNFRNLEDFNRTKSPVLDSGIVGTSSPTKGTKVVPILEVEQETVEEFLPRSYSNNEEKFECNFETLDNIFECTKEGVGNTRRENDRGRTPRNLENFTQRKSPIRDSCDDGTSTPTKGTKEASSLFELEKETPKGFISSSYSKNEEKFECNFETLDNIFECTKEGVGNTRRENDRGRTPRNLENFTQRKSPIRDSFADGTSTPTKGTKEASSLFELEKETPKGFISSSYSKNEEKFECNFETLDNIFECTKEGVGNTRRENDRGRTPRNLENFTQRKSPIRDSFADGTSTPTKGTKEASSLFELEKETPKGFISSSYSKNEEKFECNFETLDNIFECTKEGVGNTRRENDRGRTPRNLENFTQRKSPIRDSFADGTSTPTKGTKEASSLFELEKETPKGFISSSYSKNEDKFECNFEILDNISDVTREEVGYSRKESDRGSTFRNLEDFALSKSPLRDFCGDGTSSPTKGTNVVSPLSRFAENMSTAFQNSKSPIDENSTGDQISRFRNFTSPGRKSPLLVVKDEKCDEKSTSEEPLSIMRSTTQDSSFVGVTDEKCGDKSTLKDDLANRTSTTHYSSPIRSPCLLDRSPSRLDDYKQFSGSYRSARSPSHDSVSRNVSSPERISPSPMRSPSAGETRSYENVSPKSPNKIFNPFPVPLSSRQNKEVAVKLGLYKK